MQPSTHGEVHWKESARRTGKAKWAGRCQLLEIGEKLNDQQFPAPTSGSQATEPNLEDLDEFYRAMGWGNKEKADFFFATVSIYSLSLEELKILYLLQLTDEQKMSDPLAKLCQLDSEGWL